MRPCERNVSNGPFCFEAGWSQWQACALQIDVARLHHAQPTQFAQNLLGRDIIAVANSIYRDVPMTDEITDSFPDRRIGGYATTRWSLVLAAAKLPDTNEKDKKDGFEALSYLCQTYWLPLFAYAKRRTSNIEEAQDLTQSFFQKLLEKNYLATADPNRGRFRAFLITAFKNFLSNEWDKAHTIKRGGNVKTLSLDFQKGDSQLSMEPASSLTPEQIFERQWVMTLLRNTLARLSDEYDEKGKGEFFKRLKDFIVGESADTNYSELASEFNSTEAAIKMTVYRMRDRYRKILRSEISETVTDPSEIDDEIRYLFQQLEVK